MNAIAEVMQIDFMDLMRVAALVALAFLISAALSAALLAQPRPRRSGFDLTYEPVTAVRIDDEDPADDRQ